MSYALNRDAIKTILSGVAGIGVVHNRERWTTDKTKLKALFTSANKINGWQITRRSTRESRLPGEATRTYTITIRGYYGFDDQDVDASASETIIQNLVETICNAFRGNPTLNGQCETSGPMQVASVEPMMFSGYLVHYVELSIEAVEQLPVTI